MDGIDEGHLKGLLPRTDLSRRGFMVTSLAAGFALAVQPVSAETIITDSKGLIAGEVKIPVKDGQIPAYRAMPEKGKGFATVVVVQEVFGVHEHIADICRRLAKLGYFAVAPALFARQGDVSQATDMNTIMGVLAKVPDAEVASDLDATVAWAHTQKQANTVKLGITGFCWGGRQVWLYAAHNPRLKAAVAWYGPIIRQTSELTPKNVIDVVSQINVPVLGLYGSSDQASPIDVIEKLKAALKAANKACEIVVYPDAPHGFNADYRSSYRPDAAKDGWNRMLAWFKKYGVA